MCVCDSKNHKDLTDEVKRRFEALREANPLFDGKVHFPPGYRDFRGMTFPCEFRAGPYYRNDSPNEWKQHCGQSIDVEACVETLKTMGMESIEVLPPRLQQIEGEALRTSIPYFTVQWKWPETSV